MTVIKDEYISEDIVKSDLLPLSFLEKSVYTGSKSGLRFHIKKMEGDGGCFLRCSSWKGPFAYDRTDKVKIEEKDFPFSDEGLSEMISYLNSRLREKEPG